MAKVNKNKSIEERLQEAIIWDEKTPHSIPDNWVWTKFTQVVDIKGGNQPPKSKFLSEFRDGYVRFIQIRDFSSDKRLTYIPKADNLTYVEKNDVLIARYGASLGKICTGIEGACNVALAKTIHSENIDKRYLFWFLHTSIFQTPLSLLQRTAQNGFNKEDLSFFPFCLPPFAEQKRIVERIESLFEKLNQAKETIETALESWGDRKSKILHKAFTGELTNQWRCQKELNDSFETKIFSDVAIIKSNLVDPKLYQNMPHIAPDNIEKFTGRLLEYRTIQEDAVISGKHSFYKGQILYSKIRPNLSKVVIAPFDGLCSADMYPIEAKGSAKYLWYYMLSSDFLQQASTAGSRTVLPKINQRELSALKVTIPSLPEQEEIVRILDSIFEKEDKSKELLDCIDKIEVMKKTILAKAFRGHLGTSNPSDEPATELLKRILEERSITIQKSRSIVGSKGIGKSTFIQSALTSSLQQRIYEIILGENIISFDTLAKMLSHEKTMDIIDAVESLEEKRLILFNEDTKEIRLVIHED